MGDLYASITDQMVLPYCVLVCIVIVVVFCFLMLRAHAQEGCAIFFGNVRKYALIKA